MFKKITMTIALFGMLPMIACASNNSIQGKRQSSDLRSTLREDCIGRLAQLAVLFDNAATPAQKNKLAVALHDQVNKCKALYVTHETSYKSETIRSKSTVKTDASYSERPGHDTPCYEN